MQRENTPRIQLSTRQLNALKTFLEKESFSPEDVAQISYRRLTHIAGIGEKSIHLIRAWLQQFGLDILPPAAPAKIDRESKQLETAKQILGKHGYSLIPPQADHH